MRNFENERSFLQQIEIKNQEDLFVEEIVNPKDYKISINPEGGNYLVDAVSNFGFKIIDSWGNPIKINEGFVTDDLGVNVLSNLSNSNLGIGNFRFVPKSNRNYKLRIELANGVQLTKDIPKPLPSNLNLSINNLFKDKISLSLISNENELRSIENKTFYVAIHKDGQLAVSSFRMDSLQMTLHFDKTNLLPGVNTLTIFNEKLKPIAERLFFNELNFNDRLLKLSSIATIKKGDSLEVQLKIKPKLEALVHMSVSVLPIKTISNLLHTSIVSSFYWNHI